MRPYIQQALLERLAAKNYIPTSARQSYGQGLLREFKKSLGEAVADEEPSAGLHILVLGEGCPRCRQLEKSILELLSELNLPAGVDHVTAPVEIARYGVMGMPALVIGGRVVWVGSVPPKNRLKQWLEEAQKESLGEKPVTSVTPWRLIIYRKKEMIMEIKILGPGCVNCQKVEKLVRDVVAETGVEADVEKVSDIMKIAKYGVFGTPAVVVDGVVKSVGKIPKKEEVLAWLGKGAQ